MKSITEPEPTLRRGNIRDSKPGHPTRSRTWPLDSMWDYGPGYKGVSVVRDSKRKLSALIRKLESLGCTVTQHGELEANLKVPIELALPVAQMLLCTKTRHKGPQR